MKPRSRPRLEHIPTVSLLYGILLGGVVFAAGFGYFHTHGWHPSGMAPTDMLPEVKAIGGFCSLIGHSLLAGFLLTVALEWINIRRLIDAAEGKEEVPQSLYSTARDNCADAIGQDHTNETYEEYFEKKKQGWQASIDTRWWWYFSWAIAVFLPSILQMMTGFRDPSTNAPVAAVIWLTPVAVGGLEMLLALLVATKVRVDWQEGLSRVAAAIAYSFCESLPELSSKLASRNSTGDEAEIEQTDTPHESSIDDSIPISHRPGHHDIEPTERDRPHETDWEKSRPDDVVDREGLSVGEETTNTPEPVTRSPRQPRRYESGD